MKKHVVFLFLLLFTSNVCLAKTNRIGILAAMPQEFEMVKQELKKAKTIKSKGKVFLVGKIGKVPVVASLSGVGKVNAAIASQRMISEFGVYAILFTGVAGSINKSFEIGDIVLGQEIFQHDFGFLGNSFTLHAPGTMPEMGFGTGKESTRYTLDKWPVLENGKDFMSAVMSFIKNRKTKFLTITANEKEYVPKLRTGVIATGDQFIARDEKRTELLKMGADLVEMEGGAVAQVAHENGIPCLIIRSVSDKSGSTASIDFSTFFARAATNNAKILISLLNDKEFSSYFKKLKLKSKGKS